MRVNSNRASNSTPLVGTIFQLANGSIQGCNPDAEMILGYSAEEMTAAAYFDPPWQTIHQDGSAFPPQTHPGINSIKTGQAYTEIVMGFYQPQGNLVWLSVDSQPLFQGQNTQPYGAVITFRDITNQSEITQNIDKCEQTEERLKLATAAAGLGMWFWDLTTDNLEWTEQCNKLLGLDGDTEISYQLFLNTLHPEDRDRTDEAVKQALANHSEYDIEYRVVGKDGSVRWLAAKGKGFYNQDGKPVSMMGTMQDIDRRKQAEAELVKTNSILQSIISDTSSIIFVKDLEGKYVTANQSAADLLGIRIEEMLGQDDTAFFPTETAQSIMAADRQVIQKGISWAYEEEVLIGEKSRSEAMPLGLSLLTNKYPWRDNEGNILGVIGICRDITPLKQSQQQLREQEQLLRLALESANAGSWDWEINTGKIVWSPENYDLYGLDPQNGSPQYQDWDNRIHPEDRDRVNQEVQKVLEGELSQFNTEFRIVHSQRGVRWLLGIGNVTLDDEGKPIRLSGINLDITDRKLMEEQLRRSEQHLRRVLDSLYSFVGVLTPDGTLIEVNRRALEAANLQPEDVLGKPFAQAYWWSYSREIQAQLNDAIQRAAAGKLVRYDVEVRLNSEHYILIDFSLIPLFDDSGNVEYLIPSGIDITEREASKQALKQREYQLRLITEVIPQQVWTALPNGEIDYINQRWQEYTGISLEEISDRSWSAIVHPEDLERVSQTWNKAVETGGKYNIKARLRQVDGTYRWFLGRARPLRNEEGEIIKWYGTNTDITRIKQLEEKLRQQTKDLTKANQIKDEFLAIVSHELRTPLNPILGWSQLLAAGRLDAEKQSMGMEIIERNAKLQAQLIDDLLDVSRILRGKLSLKVTLVNLESVIKSALATVQLAADAKSIQITTEFAADIRQVSGDAGRLQQIVWNLVSNAIKFTPEGGRVTVKLEQVDNQAQIQVKDTGQGIDPEFLPYVFDRFRQAESSTTRKYGGLGLGLAIVRYLTELHGGTVAVTSQGEGQGSSFSVKLPLMNTPKLKTADNNSLKESVKLNRFDNLKILVVEDEVDSRDILTLVLEQEGAEVTAVTSAEEALAAFADSSFDLIISDIGMPQVDGYTLMNQIRKLPQGKDIPAIALTAYAGEVDREHSLKAGYQRHINKPIVIPELIEIITELVSG
ncbi:MAG: PAS domain S-box protein [Cyanobacteria bacterium P01_G01_bin.19]